MKRTSTAQYIFLLAAAFFAFTATAIQAQASGLGWWAVSSGGGTLTNGGRTVRCAIGQPVAGPMGGTNHSPIAGFLAIAVQTTGAPLLKIQVTRTNTFVVSWRSSSTGYVLQQNATLVAATWINVPQAPVDDGTATSVVLPVLPGRLYFRLQK